MISLSRTVYRNFDPGSGGNTVETKVIAVDGSKLTGNNRSVELSEAVITQLLRYVKGKASYTYYNDHIHIEYGYRAAPLRSAVSIGIRNHGGWLINDYLEAEDLMRLIRAILEEADGV